MFLRHCVPLGVLLLASCTPTAPRPNVLLITIDTTRADHLSCYGYEKETTPRLDRLAAGGLRFENAISQASVTPVSHASILTGLNPYTHGLRVLHGLHETRLASEHTTVAEVLRAGGWSTGAFVSAFPVTERFGLEQGYDTFDSDFLVQDSEAIIGPGGMVNTGPNQRRGDKTTDLALGWLETAPRPFHLWVHYFDVHDEHVVPPIEYINRFGKFSKDLHTRLKKLYDVELEYMDEQIGRVLDQLELSGEIDNTVVVVVSDHGEGLGDHDWWTHGLLYQEQINVPLILAGPGIPTAVASSLVSTADIAATIYELCGIDEDDRPPSDGFDLLLSAAGKVDPARSAYSDSVNLLTYGSVGQIQEKKDEMLFCAIQGRWKFTHHLTRPFESELYDLLEDPKELDNLYEKRPDIVKRMRDLAVGGGHVPEEQLDHNNMSEADKERLRSLGYVGDEEKR